MVSRLGFVPLQVSVLLQDLNSLRPYMMSRERHANASHSSFVISAHCGTPCEWFGISLFTRFRY